jgi:hypothetical protein
MKSTVSLALLPSAAYDARLQLAADVLELQRRFTLLPAPHRNRAARNAHVTLALQALEELLKNLPGRVEQDLLFHVGHVLTNPAQVDRIADEAECLIHDLPPAPGLDLVDTGLGIGLIDNIAYRVAILLQHFSPTF